VEGFSPLHSVSLHLVWAFSAVVVLACLGVGPYGEMWSFGPRALDHLFLLTFLELSSILWFGGFFLGWSVWDEVTLLPVLS